MKRWVIGVTAGLTIAAPSAAAGQVRGWVPPDCDLSTGHYLVNSAVLYLKNSSNTRFVDQRERDLRDTRRVLLQALDQGQDDNAAVWYFLGRYYAETNDLAGMDSAFDRAAAMAPQCTGDIRAHRRRLWVPLLNNAVDRIRAGDNDAALAALQRANTVYDAEPPGFYYLAQLWAGRQEPDSAVAYFTRAMQIAADSANRDNEQYRELRTDAMFNVASLYHMRQEYDSAVSWYRRYQELRPGDPQGLTRQADALSEAGRAEEALALYDAVLARADSISTLDLFQAGVAMFRAGRYARAAEAFENGLQRNPYFRDALFNLANTYLSMANEADSGSGAAAQKRAFGEKMAPVVERLLEVDPQSSASLRLRAAAFQLRDLPDSTLAVLEQTQAMTFDVTVSRFAPAGSGYDVRGIITNLTTAPLDVPALTFDFVNASGEVVQTITVEARTVEAEGVAPFALAPVGEGIAAWRYRAGS